MTSTVASEIDEPAPPRERRQRVQAAETCLAVLKALATLGGRASLTAIAGEVEESPAKVHRYLASLMAEGLVEQDRGGTQYALAAEAMRVGLAAMRQSDPIRLAEPALLHLRDVHAGAGLRDIGLGGGARCRAGVRRRARHVEREAQAVLQRAAVVVAALVGERADEGREQVAVRAVQFEPVEAGLGGAAGGGHEVGGELVHVGPGQGARRLVPFAIGHGAGRDQRPVAFGQGLIGEGIRRRKVGTHLYFFIHL